MVQAVESKTGGQAPRLASIARLPTRAGRAGVLGTGDESRVWIEALAPPRLSPGAARCLLNILVKAAETDNQVDPVAPKARAVSS